MLNRFLLFVCALTLVGTASAEAQTTALFFDSQPGDPIGRGLQQTWTDANLQFTGSVPYASHVRLHADNFPPTGGTAIWWDLDFTFPASTGLAPGIYEYAGDGIFGSPLRAGLRINGSGSGCSANGRFVVYEVSADSAGRLTSFAADFEQHCDDRIPALFGAIRFKSARSDLNPFDGAYPVYALHIDGSPFGRITGGGIDCGESFADCDEQYGVAPTVTLTATPAPGYVFLGWTGDCIGRLAPTSLVVTLRKRCAPVFDALPDSGIPPPLAGGTALFVDRQAQPFRAADRWVSLASDTQFSVSGSPGHVSVTMQAWDGERWDVMFSAPDGQPLAPGVYNDARRDPFHSPMTAGFSMDGHDTDCNELRARFVVYEVSFDGAGQLQRFAADFEQRCDNEIDGLAGAIRFNSARGRLIPFDGAYPVYRLDVVPPVNGVISGEGIDCSVGGSDCTESYATGRTVRLAASPAAGYIFIGWTGDCSGSAAGTVVVRLMERCGAVFDNEPGAAGPLPDDLRLGSLFFFSQKGDFIGQGQRQVWTRADSLFALDPQSGPLTTQQVHFRVSTPDGNRWGLDFVVPAGQVLRPGDFTGATRYPFQASTVPGMDVYGHGRGCNDLIGRFRIYEVHFDSTGKVDQFAADFEQHCERRAPALFGAIRYNSSRPSLLPFDGEFLPKPSLALENPVNGSSVGRPFTISGYAINTGDTSGTGVDAVHVYAFPAGGGAPIFLGVATYGLARADVAAVYGTQFRNSGFSLNGGGQLPDGTYTIAAIARDTLTGTFNTVKLSSITIATPVAAPRVTIEQPAPGASVAGTFDIAGWAIDTGAPAGTGVDAIHVYAIRDGTSDAIFLGVGEYGQDRPDVGAAFGGQFRASGYRLHVTGVSALTPGGYTMYVFARSTVTGQFYWASRAFTRVPGGAMAVDVPAANAHVTGSFLVAGWAIDADASSGPGVDTVHVWALATTGGPAVFLGAAAPDAARPDVAALFGDRFLMSGYNLFAPALPRGAYTVVVFAHSVATGTFSQARTLTIVVD